MKVKKTTLAHHYAGLEAIDIFLADQLLESLNSSNQVLQHLVMALSQSLRSGHTCLPLAEITHQTYWARADETLNKVAHGYTFGTLESLQDSLNSVAVLPIDNAPLVFEDDRLYLRRYWQYEQDVAKVFNQRMQPTRLDGAQKEQVETLLVKLFPKTKANHKNWQEEAVKDALERQISVISGGPGTGKTYTVARLLIALQAINEKPLNMAMVAPTGKAKQRLLESILAAKSQLLAQGIDQELVHGLPDNAHTLHGLLGMRPNSHTPKFHQDNPLPLDLLLVDEVSMVDLPMMAKLLAAINPHCKLVMVGDAQQLPSVAAGSILADMPERAMSYLHKSHRFDGEGGIGLLAQKVRDNNADESYQLLKSHHDLKLVGEEDFDSFLENVCQQYLTPMIKASSLEDAFVCLNQFRVLAATRQGELGVEGLNHRIEGILSKQLPQVRLGQNYQGKPVMVTKNHHGLGLFNGDIGIMWPQEDGQLNVCFSQNNQVKKYHVGLLQDLETVYAMTIHKTQGSEFDHVALIVPANAQQLLSSQLLYTAITRAKTKCSVYVSDTLWRQGVTCKAKRFSGLKALLA